MMVHGTWWYSHKQKQCKQLVVSHCFLHQQALTVSKTKTYFHSKFLKDKNHFYSIFRLQYTTDDYPEEITLVNKIQDELAPFLIENNFYLKEQEANCSILKLCYLADIFSKMK